MGCISDLSLFLSNNINNMVDDKDNIREIAVAFCLIHLDLAIPNVSFKTNLT